MDVFFLGVRVQINSDKKFENGCLMEDLVSGWEVKIQYVHDFRHYFRFIFSLLFEVYVFRFLGS